MTQEELITMQQLVIEDFKQKSKENSEILKTIIHKVVGIGHPLNDNVLKMNNKQLVWVTEILHLIESINC